MGEDKTSTLVIRLTPSQLASYQSQADRPSRPSAPGHVRTSTLWLTNAERGKNLVRVGGRVVEWDRTL